MAVPPVVALEIGTSKTLALVGELREDGHVMITGMGERMTVGVRKGEIIDLENVGGCVRSALAMAEESGKVTIRQIHLALSGGHIQGVANRGTSPVLDPAGEISQEDIEEVMNVARAMNLSPDREILHTICQHFCVDNQERVLRPEGMEGHSLGVDMLIIHGVRSRLHNSIRAVRNTGVEVQDVVFSGLCAALSVLTPEQKKGGAVVIDMGAGTTNYVAYADSVLAAAGVLGVGGDHVTNDIGMAFNIPQSQAERLKRESGSAVPDGISAIQKVSLPGEGGFPGRTVNVGALNTVINARVAEIFNLIRKRMEELDILHRLGAGIVLTGGGAHLGSVAGLAERIFGVPCSVGRPRNISGLATATEGPEYAVCCGLVQYGFRTQRSHKGGAHPRGWWRWILGGGRG
jgi:cell division protein FtsA